MSWLKQIHAAEQRVPDWFTWVADHPMFSSLDRLSPTIERGWRIVTRAELEFEAPSLREVCDRFTERFGPKR